MAIRRILPKVGKPQLMDSLEREYLRNLLRYQKAYKQMLSDSLADLLPDLKKTAGKESIKSLEDMPVRLDSAQREIRMDQNFEEKIRNLFDSVKKRMDIIFPASMLRVWAQAMASNVNNVSKKNTVKAAKSADLNIEPLLKDGQLNPFFENVVDENIGLIRSIGFARLPELKNRLVHGLTQDLPSKTIGSLISDHLNTSKNQAKLIARDQVNKLNGHLNMYRQKQLGSKRYIWRTVGDERVRGNPGGKYPKARPSHYSLDGKTFSWDQPPVSGTRGEKLHPGQAILCRCHAEMVLDDLVE